MQIFAGVLWRKGVKWEWVIENVDFQGFWMLRLQYVRKWGQHYYIVLFSPLLPFQWPQNMTLNDVDGLFGVKFCFRAGLAGWDCATSENNCMKTNKDRHIQSAVQISGMDSSFWRYKVRADIRSGSVERRRCRTVGSRVNAHVALCVNITKTVRDTSKVTIND